MMIDLAEQFMQDKDTLLNLYLDAIINLETLQYDFEADDLQNRFGAYRRNFNSELVSPAARNVDKIIKFKCMYTNDLNVISKHKYSDIFTMLQ